MRMVPPYPHLDVPISVQEDVSELEVAVDDLVSVEVAGRLQDLQHVPPRLLLREALGLADQLREGLETCFGSVAWRGVRARGATYIIPVHVLMAREVVLFAKHARHTDRQIREREGGRGARARRG